MSFIEGFFVGLVGVIIGDKAGKFIAGCAEMYYGERLSSRATRRVSFCIRWGVFALCMLGAIALTCK